MWQLSEVSHVSNLLLTRFKKMSQYQRWVHQPNALIFFRLLKLSLKCNKSYAQ
jgi:hypothetical protein